ncbi:MAG: hypothetical protein AAFP69_14160, partial [Planctomycetota bacterium]
MAQFLSEFFSIGNLFTLLMLILLQAVLGFDNLLYISIESKRVEEKSQGYVRRWGHQSQKGNDLAFQKPFESRSA